MSIPHVDIPLEVGEVVSRVQAALALPQLVYLWGHPLEIVNTLQEYTKNSVKEVQKFPLVALYTDIPVRKHSPADGFFGLARLHIIIANLTKREYKAPERLTLNFQPILQPIKEELVKQIDRHGQWTRLGELQYEEIERYYWGKQGLYGNDGNIFNDYIDCIELRDIQINIYNKKPC
jgi:hypothetical protein